MAWRKQARSEAAEEKDLCCGSEFDVIGAVRNQLVAKSGFDVGAAQKKGAGHTLHIAGRQTDKVSVQPGEDHAVDAFAIQILAEFGVSEAKSVIKFALGIGESRQIVELIGGKEFRGAIFRAQMNKGQSGTLGFNLRAEFSELGDRLAAKSSTEMTEKNEK